jgi:dolichol-phosphate mannosyltransferase
MRRGSDTRFALIVPTLNEANNIQTLLRRACDALATIEYDWEILVVDDSSRDGTDTVVQDYALQQPRVRLIARRGERGLAGAITYGWSQTDAELLGVIDADLQHPPELLPKLMDGISDGIDIVIASRYLRPHSMDGWNPMRKLLSRLSVLASLPVQRRTIRVRDPLSGFFVIRRECILGLDFQKTGFKLLLEVLAKARIKQVREVPYKFSPRTQDHSKANWTTGLHYAALLMKLVHRSRSVENEE